MTRMILVVSVLLAATAVPAAAGDAKPAISCINTQNSYVARRLNRHEVFVQNSIGKPRPPLRLKTSCINLEPAIGIGLSTSFTCIGLGDQVVATTVDGRREQCVVTGVMPYEPAKDDLK